MKLNNAKKNKKAGPPTLIVHNYCSKSSSIHKSIVSSCPIVVLGNILSFETGVDSFHSTLPAHIKTT
jgi:hypothetical protein